MQYNQRLKELRISKNLTQSQIAKELETTQKQYSRWENDGREMTYEMLIKFAKFYECTTDYLLGISDIKNPYKD